MWLQSQQASHVQLELGRGCVGIEVGGLGGERGGSPHWRYFTADGLGCQVDIKLDPVALRLLIYKALAGRCVSGQHKCLG